MLKIVTHRRLLTLVLLCVSLAACSQDKHVFLSTVNLPTTVTLYDPLTDQPVWSKDVPVGQKLVLDLDREGEDYEFATVSGLPATHMDWKTYDIASNDLVGEDQVALAGVPIVIKVNYRPSPEYPPDFRPPYPTSAPAPAAVPAVSTVEPQPDRPSSVKPIRVHAPAAEPDVVKVAPTPVTPPAAQAPTTRPTTPDADAEVDSDTDDAVIEVSPLDLDLEIRLEESLKDNHD